MVFLLVFSVVVGIFELGDNIASAEEGTEGTWWDYQWSYRKALHITDVPDGSQVYITIYKENGHDGNGVIDCENNCNEDFSDLRFINNGEKLPYWIENIGSDGGDYYAQVWVNIADSDTIYLYYGNAYALDNSNGYETFPFFDDFTSNTTQHYFKHDIPGGHYYMREATIGPQTRLRWKSNLYEINAEGWAGHADFGACQYNASNPGESVFLQMYYNKDVGATETQPALQFRASGTETDRERGMPEGSDYIYEITVDSLSGSSACHIWDESYHLLWDKSLNSAPSNLNYLSIYHFDYNHHGGCKQEKIEWLEADEQLRSFCKGDHYGCLSWIDNRIDWWFVASYTDPETALSTIGGQEEGNISRDAVYVDDDFDNTTAGWNVTHFDTIQGGIDNVSINGTVIIYDGTYEENLIISKPLHIIGEDSSTVVIDGNGIGDVITITADGCAVQNLSIRNSGSYAGMKISSNGNLIHNNRIFDNYYGIWVDSVSANTISNNVISNNKGGIRLRNADDTTVTDNEFSLNIWEGLSLESSHNAVVTGNTFQNNGIMLSGPRTAWTTHTIEDNLANNRPIYYYKNDNEFIVPSNAGQVIVANCTDVTIQGLTITNVEIGIQLGFSSYVTIAENTFTSNSQSAVQLYYADGNTIRQNALSGSGIDFWESSSNTLQQNSITDADIGLNLYDSAYNRIMANHITDNTFGIWLHNYCHENVFDENIIAENPRGGIWLMAGCTANIFTNNTINSNGELSPHHANVYLAGESDENVFYHNNFISNFVNAYDTNVNSWDRGAILGGNYWSDYDGIDTDEDGFGDTPHSIPGGNNQDSYPFMYQNGWNHAPYAAGNPSPPNGATDVPLDIILNWTGGDPDPSDTVTYDIYLGDTSSPALVTRNQTGTSYDPDLSYNTAYYWRIVTWDACGFSTIGPVWTFITESGPPIANFRWSPQSPEKHEVAYFTDTSIEQGKEIVIWDWFFGDGDTSNQQHPTHTYTSSGPYMVTLMITDETGQSNRISKYLYVDTLPPTADFTYTPVDPSTNDRIQFTDTSTADPENSIISHSWTFGDNTNSTLSNLTHQYDEAGTYTVTLTVRDTVGGEDSISKDIMVSGNILPVAMFTFSPSEPTQDDVIQFIDQSTDEDGTVVSRLWTFGDGSSSGLQHPTHRYQYNGTYRVTLTVTDNGGAQNTKAIDLHIGNILPSAKFAFIPLHPMVGDVVSFFDESTDIDGTIISWHWHFGDGTTSTAQNPTHQYRAPGPFRVTLTVTDNSGETDSYYTTVEVTANARPHADPGGPYTGRPGEVITFDGSGSSDSDGTIVGYRWDFNNDGVYDTEWLLDPMITHSYASIGTYVVRLEVKDDGEVTDTGATIVTISANNRPLANAGGPYVGFVNTSLMLDGSRSRDPDGSIVGYRWDFTNDGVYDTEWLTITTITHTYSTAGMYTVKLEVKDNDGETNTDTATVQIQPFSNDPPVADAGGPYSGYISDLITVDGSGSFDPEGALAGYRWDWTNDGVWDTDWLSTPTATHSYPAVGTYTVKLQVKDDINQTDIDTTVVTVTLSPNGRPNADAGGPYSGRVDELITFDGSDSSDSDGSIVSYQWDFNNDEVYDTDWLITPITTHSYSSIGTYIVKLQVKDDDGAVDTDAAVVTISVNIPPEANAGGPYAAHVGDIITIDGSNSSDSDGSVTGYRWDFTNDGTWDTNWLTTPTATHAYDTVGTYIVALEVRDNDAGKSTDTAIATISVNTPPDANAGGPYVGVTGISLIFDGSASNDSDGSIVGYRWDFTNDGVYDTDWIMTIATYTYSSAGTYIVKLQVKDDDGAVDDDIATVTISSNDQPIADAGGPYSGYVNDVIRFDGSDSHDTDGSIVGYRWDFTNNGIYDTDWSTTSTITHNYAIAGTYTVKLQVKDDDGATGTDTATVIVSDSYLRGLWHLDEYSGIIAYDYSGNNNNGMVHGASWTASGKFNNGLHFDGDHDYVLIPGITSSYDAFTVSIWANVDNTAGYQPIISRQDGTGSGRDIIVIESGEIDTYIGGGTGVNGGFFPESGEWYHYVLTYEYGLLKIYVDGILRVTENVTEEDATGAFIVGSGKSLTQFFGGIIDETAIWNRALYESEIQNLYSVPNQPTFEYPANRTKWVNPDIGRLSCVVSEPYSFETPVVEQILIGDTLYDRVTQGGTQGYGDPGEPCLPASGAYLLLPQGTEVSNITINTGKLEQLEGSFMIEPMPMPTKLSEEDEDTLLVPDEAIYNSDEMFPGKLFTEVGTYNFRGYDILVLTLHPVQYIPATGELFYYRDMLVSVETSEGEDTNTLYRNLEIDQLAVGDIVDNPDVAGMYGAGMDGEAPDDQYDLVIITTNALKDGFEPLKQAHDSEGTATLIYTVENIYSEYSGVDAPEKIRNFIRDAYINLGIEYVLIGGDDNIVPARQLWVQAWPGSYYTTYMPSDLYYGCLDGTYNRDNDGRWGEPYDGDNGGDVDLVAEVYVGRACVGSVAEADNFVSKTIAYMNTDEDEYLNKVLFVGEYLGFHGASDWGGNHKDEMIDGSTMHGYTTVGIPSNEYNIETLYDRDGSWSRSEIMNEINEGVHIINHLGHASYSYNMKMYNSHVDSLTNDKYCFIYSQGCMAGGFDNGDCIAEHFTVKTEHAAVAGIWNARYGWGRYYSTDGPSQRFDREFWDAVFNENLSVISKANQDSKEDNLHRIWSSCMRWCYYELNLFGDPTLDFVNREPTIPQKDGPMDVGFYLEDDTLIGVDTGVANNSVASVDIESLTRYTNVSWYVIINDGFNDIVGPMWWFTVEAYDWDINRDGRVDDIDSTLLIGQYGETGEPGWIREDIIRDGRINILDLLAFVNHYGESYVIEFEQNDAEDTLTVTAVHLNGIRWDDLEISGTANLNGLGTYVAIGNQITGCTDTIMIVYKPVNTVSWTWTFANGSAPDVPPDEPDEEPPIQSTDCDINGDGTVDDTDVELVTDHYGETGEPGWIPEDINNDGSVDYLDISALVENYEGEDDEIEPQTTGQTNNEDTQPSASASNDEEEEPVDEIDENVPNMYTDIYTNLGGIIRPVTIAGTPSYLYSIDDDAIPEYIVDNEAEMATPVMYAPAEITDITVNKQEETIIVTIQVEKAEWIYIEVKDLYPDITKVTVKTSDNRAIASDMIWRENDTIYILDDPDTEYRLIYHTAPASVNSATESMTSGGILPAGPVVGATGIMILLMVAVVLQYKKTKTRNDKIREINRTIKEADRFIKAFTNDYRSVSVERTGKKDQLLKMVYADDVDAASVTNALDLSMPELESFVHELVDSGLMQYTSDDEVEITRKGIRHIKSK